MPTPDLEERFRRWLKLTAEMHDNANFRPNASIAWTPMRKPLATTLSRMTLDKGGQSP